MTTKKESHVQTVKGTVVKLGQPQTIRVAIKITKVHPLYKKRYTQTRFYLAHDENQTAKVGDVVTIAACRPISKTKHWQLI